MRQRLFHSLDDVECDGIAPKLIRTLVSRPCELNFMIEWYCMVTCEASSSESHVDSQLTRFLRLRRTMNLIPFPVKGLNSSMLSPPLS